eukprot:s8407_g4.t1
MSAVAHDSELAQSMDPLQYVRASPQGIPDEHLNPSSEADVNRDINRCGRLPEVAILPTILAWDPDQGRVVRLIGDMRMALSILHDHHIIHGDVWLANIMVRLDPPSFVLIDYGGCLESLWPVKQGANATPVGCRGLALALGRLVVDDAALPVSTSIEASAYHPSVISSIKGDMVRMGISLNRPPHMMKVLQNRCELGIAVPQRMSRASASHAKRMLTVTEFDFASLEKVDHVADLRPDAFHNGSV